MARTTPSPCRPNSPVNDDGEGRTQDNKTSLHGGEYVPPKPVSAVGHGDPPLIALAEDAPFIDEQWPRLVPLEGTFVLPVFPTEALPVELREFVEALAEATQTPPALSALMVLSVISAAVAGRVEIQPKVGWVEPANIYIAVGLASGNRKTTVTKEVRKPLQEAEDAVRLEMHAAIGERAIQRRMLERALREIEKQAGRVEAAERRLLIAKAQKIQAELDTIPAQILPRLTVDDITPESLGIMMEQHGGRMAIISGETDIFELIGGRYSNSSNIGLFLQSHAGDPVLVDRVNRPPVSIKNPALTLGVSTQPWVIRELGSKQGFAERGLLSRILFSIPQSPLGERKLNPEPVPEPVRRGYHEIVIRLISTLGLPDGRAPVRVVLTEEAQGLLLAYRSEIEPQLANASETQALIAWLSKLPGAVVRIAGLLHASQSPDLSQPITAKNMGDAITIGKYLGVHAVAVFDAMGAVEEVRDARVIMDWIAKDGCKFVSVPQIRVSLRSRLKNRGRVQSAIDVLVEHGFLRLGVPKQREFQGRPPDRQYEVRPKLFEVKPAPEIPIKPERGVG